MHPTREVKLIGSAEQAPVWYLSFPSPLSQSRLSHPLFFSWSSYGKVYFYYIPLSQHHPHIDSAYSSKSSTKKERDSYVACGWEIQYVKKRRGLWLSSPLRVIDSRNWEWNRSSCRFWSSHGAVWIPWSCLRKPFWFFQRLLSIFKSPRFIWLSYSNT